MNGHPEHGVSLRDLRVFVRSAEGWPEDTKIQSVHPDGQQALIGIQARLGQVVA